METTPSAEHSDEPGRHADGPSGARTRRDPIRTCVGCRRRLVPSAMVRCAIATDGTVAIGRTAPGRGAWLCSPECFGTARRRRGFERAWRRPLPAGALEVLEPGISNAFESTTTQMREWTAAGSASDGPTPTKG